MDKDEAQRQFDAVKAALDFLDQQGAPRTASSAISPIFSSSRIEATGVYPPTITC
jgi:hypothetical protein